MSTPPRTRKVVAKVVITILCAEDQEEAITHMASAMIIASKSLIFEAANSTVNVANAMAQVGERETPIVIQADIAASDVTEHDKQREAYMEAEKAAQASPATYHVGGNA